MIGYFRSRALASALSLDFSELLGMLEAQKEAVFFMKTGSQKGKHFPAEIRQNFPLPDRNRNRKMEPDIRPEPDFAGYPVGS